MMFNADGQDKTGDGFRSPWRLHERGSKNVDGRDEPGHDDDDKST